MPAWSSYSYFFGPLVAAGAIGVFVLILRWSSKKGSLVALPPEPGRESDYGLLTAVSRPKTYVEGELQRRSLAEAGIRATLTRTTDGPRLMVWPDDVERARSLLRSWSG